MSFISSAELVILRKMYPEGCRVSLERMVDEPYAKLHPGDLGTVRNVDDAGQIHISWDQGSSVAVIYKVDRQTAGMEGRETSSGISKTVFQTGNKW